MRFRITTICAVAFVALVTVACQKEINEPEKSFKHTHDVVFNLTEPASKTTIKVDGNKADITWENTPVQYVHLFENGKEGTDLSLNISSNNESAVLKATFGLGDINSKFEYKAIIASKYSDGIATLPEIQYPTATSFDPAADILVGKSAVFTYYLINGSNVDLRFARLNAISRLVLKGLKAGEKIEFIEIIATNGIAGDLKPFDNFEFAGYSDNGSKRISLYFRENNTVASDGTFSAIFTSWAVEPGALTVKVFTDKSAYSKSTNAEGLRFNFDKFRNINVDMTGCDSPSERFELVTSTPSNWAGTYLITNSDKAGSVKAFNASAKSSGYVADVTASEYEGKLCIAADNTTKAMSLDFSKASGNYWNVMLDGKYLYDNNGITLSSSNHTGLLLTGSYHYHTLAYSEGVQMTSNAVSSIGTVSSSAYLGYDGSKFAYSNSSASRVYLFKLNDNRRKDQILAFENEKVHFPLVSGKYELGKAYDPQPFARSSSYLPELITWYSSDPSVASIDEQTGKITLNKEGEVIITAKAVANEEYRSASASYELTISSPYYQRITSTDEITSGDKYLIVSRTQDLLKLTNYYHAFSATTQVTYDFDINKFFDNLLNNIVYDNGTKIKSTPELDANQVLIEKDLLSSIASLVGLKGNYTIKPLSVNKYLYCDMTAEIAGTGIQIPTYQIGFSDANLSSFSLTNITAWFNEIATVPHSITFDEDGTASIRSAVSKSSAIGADLFYSKLTGNYAYVNMMLFDNFDDIASLLTYLTQNSSEYSWMVNIIKLAQAINNNISIKDVINYFSAELYIYKYIE